MADVSTYSNETTTTEETVAKLIAPDLPVSIQGDGRYLMSLLRSFLAESTKQINLANGFTAEELDPSAEGAVQTPRNFKLTFTRLGGELTWDHIRDVGSLAYYEVRTDTDVGDNAGLLERTIDNSSTALPVTAVGHVYLYAVNQEGEYSTPTEILYSKPRPDKPQNISISNTSDGTLITFSEIPTNCIGAYVYLDGVRYTAYDNIFPVKSELNGVELIEVSFFDQFGEGERGVLYLVLPDVTGFLVERNGSQLDFYWNAINVYNIKYVVKVCSELNWEQGVELFRTATNDKNRHLYPNPGDYYLMVKAYDEYGNYSKNAAYQLMTTPTEIDKNVIFEQNQSDLLYSGNKLNVYYNPEIDGITLEREYMHGEYIFGMELPQQYRARNWMEAEALVLDTENNGVWDDATVFWQDAESMWGGIVGDADGISVKYEIAMYRGLESEDSPFAAELNGDLLTAAGLDPAFALNADDFRNGRWAELGLYMSQLTKLEYDLTNIPQEFSLMFNLRIMQVLPETALMVLANDDGDWLMLSYRSSDNCIVLMGSDGGEVAVRCWTEWALSTIGSPTWSDSLYPWYESMATFGTVQNYGAISDWLTFGISQSAEGRRVFVHSVNKQETLSGFAEFAPLGNFNKLYCYPKLI